MQTLRISWNFSENSFHECFGEWWEHKVNLINQNESSALPGDEETQRRHVGGGGGEGDTGQSLPFPDKTNLRNGELTQELFGSCSTYFINLKEAPERKEVSK